jgi:hypothetical protein
MTFPLSAFTISNVMSTKKKMFEKEIELRVVERVARIRKQKKELSTTTRT